MAIQERNPPEIDVSDRPQPVLDRVVDYDLPGHLCGLVDAYEETVGDRDPFLWKWAHHLFPKFTLSCVPPSHVDQLRDHKLVGLMFVSVLDDIAEMHGDRATFEEAAKLPFDHQSANADREGVDEEVLSFGRFLWDRFAPALCQAPRTAEFEELFRFNLKQVLNAIDFSFVANEDVALVNGSDLQTYDAHNMMLYTFADIDIVHSPTFDRSELPTLRRVLERAQRMVRIGNWVTTWQRELSEADLSSGIVVHAIENDIVSADELAALRRGPDEATVATIAETIQDHRVEEVFLSRWREELACARDLEGDIDSVDIESYLDGIETVMRYHLASRGMK